MDNKKNSNKTTSFKNDVFDGSDDTHVNDGQNMPANT